MNFKKIPLKTSVLFSLFLLNSGAFAWGERGHHVICEVATRLVEMKGLREFLSGRAHVMGHLCNLPDIYWKSLGAEAKSGDAGHYFDLDRTGLKLDEVPLSYESFFSMSFQTAEGEKKGSELNLPEYLGSLWWRGDQFYRRGLSAGKMIAGLPLPAREQQQNWEFPFNKAVFEMMEAMGIMGHFAGDASMPYHTYSDYDGWGSGHGGIHAYYESFSVNDLGLDLPKKVFLRAQQVSDFKKLKVDQAPLALSVLKKISALHHADRAKIERLDPVLSRKNKFLKKGAEPVAVANLNVGQKKVPPERQASSVGAKRFGELIVSQLATSARGLAFLWDSIYLEAGSPDLSAYRSYRYPLKADFVPLDYIPTKFKVGQNEKEKK